MWSDDDQECEEDDTEPVSEGPCGQRGVAVLAFAIILQ